MAFTHGDILGTPDPQSGGNGKHKKRRIFTKRSDRHRAKNADPEARDIDSTERLDTWNRSLEDEPPE
ncbi:MAG: hypothetical protein KAS32_27615 [Candidatus Peribacteraceae bacterium]|nr:hypothetical protein [Candidatus Peribacteraceae bacterium]